MDKIFLSFPLSILCATLWPLFWFLPTSPNLVIPHFFGSTVLYNLWWWHYPGSISFSLRGSTAEEWKALSRALPSYLPLELNLVGEVPIGEETYRSIPIFGDRTYEVRLSPHVTVGEVNRLLDLGVTRFHLTNLFVLPRLLNHAPKEDENPLIIIQKEGWYSKLVKP